MNIIFSYFPLIFVNLYTFSLYYSKKYLLFKFWIKYISPFVMNLEICKN